MYILGMTGGISCGKSAVAETLRRYAGATTLDIDKVTRWLLEPGGDLFEIYVRHFGKYILTREGYLNRRLVGEIIFNHRDEREWINSVAHPILLNKARDFLVECSEAGAGLVVLEVPLLFEAGWEHLFDEIWAVYTKRKFQIQRLMARDKLTNQQALTRINAQMEREEVCARADVVIRNVGSYIKVRRQVFRALRGRKF
ncbi:MAG: dephospho-CoA kinase [Selenomonadaceae bacterium]|nr:dephospho-CoA kinase [Selenomonadaceae bacterium]MBQ7492953.1 dephospho-CoA kinase [Selenomonadaceae bacterium]